MLTKESYGFAISDSLEIINSLYFVDDRAEKLLLETFNAVNRKKNSVEGKLYQYITEYHERAGRLYRKNRRQQPGDDCGSGKRVWQ
jgi:hypothetical protein